MTSIVVEANKKKRRRNEQTCTNHKKRRKTNNDAVKRKSQLTCWISIQLAINRNLQCELLFIVLKQTREEKKNEYFFLTTGRSHITHVIRIRNKSREHFFFRKPNSLRKKTKRKQKWRPGKRSVHKTMADFWRRFHHFLI